MRFVINDTIPKQFNTKGDIVLIADYTNCPCKEHIFHSTCNTNCECWGEPYET